MLNHLDVVLCLKIIKKQYPFITSEVLRNALHGYTNLPFTPRDMHIIESTLEDIPTKYIVHGLKEKGYNVSGIASLLDISPAAVSQHLKAPPKKPYTCHIINSIMKTYESKKFGEWQAF